jgi:putative ABC transport system permease protein
MNRAGNTKAFWAEIWGLALQSLRAHKVRVMLAMLGVIIGSACIVLVVTIALAGRRYIVGQIEGVGANLVYADVARADERGTVTLADQITPADLDAVKQGLPGIVAEAGGTSSMQMAITADGKVRPITMVGVTEGLERIRNLEILRGSYFGQDDLQSSAKVCLLTESLAKRVFPYESAVGNEFRAGDLQLKVIGVFRERVATLGYSEFKQDSVIIPFSLLRHYTGKDYFSTLYVQADRSEDVPMLTRQVEEILRSRHRSGARYRVQNLVGLLETAREIATVMTLVLVVIALITLTISGIGIMNIMLVTVTERTREIGIRMAIGASRDAIRYQFLMEALAISGTGALAGIFIAVMIPALVNFLLSFFPEAAGITVPVSWISVVLAFVVSCSTGLIFGYLPANRAANLQPTESLRYE